MDAGPGDTRPEVTTQLDAARLEFDAQSRRFERNRAQLEATFEQIRNGRPQRELLHDSAFARLQARLDTMPVIEQAKGVLMAQHRCGPEEAFDLLRRASQSANVKVSVLAARIIEQVATQEPRPNGNGPRPTPDDAAGRTAKNGYSASLLADYSASALARQAR